MTDAVMDLILRAVPVSLNAILILSGTPKADFVVCIYSRLTNGKRYDRLSIIYLILWFIVLAYSIHLVVVVRRFCTFEFMLLPEGWCMSKCEYQFLCFTIY